MVRLAWSTARGPPRVGMLLGARGFQVNVPLFKAGIILQITATLLQQDERLGSFECEVTDCSNHHTTLATGLIDVYQPTDAELMGFLG